MAIWLGPTIGGVLILALVIYMIWRMGHSDEEMEAGGSWGEELGGKESDTGS